ncbi:MAG: hypothetical protein HQ510_07190 [Candidatus Marinimicrobia bacterium]|nr:hypothetical protein [Candidatus Neomarinimicrobiota bacterium]
MKENKLNLERIAHNYLNPPSFHKIDVKIQLNDLEKIYKYVKGPNILEMGYGDGHWTRKNIECFGKSNIVDASETLSKFVESEYGNKVKYYELTNDN